MPLVKQTTLIPFARGMQEKQGQAFRQPPDLEQCLDFEFDKVGELNVRRGYRTVNGSNTVMPQSGTTVHADAQIYGCAVRGIGEVAMFGWDWLYKLAWPSRSTSDRPTFVQCCPIARGVNAFFDGVASQSTNASFEYGGA